MISALLCLLAARSSMADIMAAESRLVDNLFQNYNSQVRPQREVEKPTDINFGFTLQDIKKLDHSGLSMIAWLNLRWEDPRLQWNRSEYNNIESIRLNSDMIWLPDIELYNVVDTTFLSRSNQIVLTFDGSIIWVPPYRLTATCKVDLTWFPYDQQKCAVKFGSWTHDGFKLNLTLQEQSADTSSFVMNEEFELIGAPAKRNEIFYECCPEPYIDLTYQIMLKRRSTPFMMKNMASSILCYSLALAALVLPSHHAPTAKILVILFALAWSGASTKDIPDKSILMSFLQTHAGMILFMLFTTICIVSICVVPLNSLNPLLRSCVHRLTSCRHQGVDKEITDDERRNTFTSWMDRINFTFHLLLFLIIIPLQFGSLPSL